MCALRFLCIPKMCSPCMLSTRVYPAHLPICPSAYPGPPAQPFSQSLFPTTCPRANASATISYAILPLCLSICGTWQPPPILLADTQVAKTYLPPQIGITRCSFVHSLSGNVTPAWNHHESPRVMLDSNHKNAFLISMPLDWRATIQCINATNHVQPVFHAQGGGGVQPCTDSPHAVWFRM